MDRNSRVLRVRNEAPNLHETHEPAFDGGRSECHSPGYSIVGRPDAAQLRALRPRNNPGELPLLWTTSMTENPSPTRVQQIARRLLKMAPQHAPAEPMRHLLVLAGLSPLNPPMRLSPQSGANELEDILEDMTADGTPEEDEMMSMTTGQIDQDDQRLQDFMNVLYYPTSQVSRILANVSNNTAVATSPGVSDLARALSVLAPPNVPPYMREVVLDLAANDSGATDMSREDAHRTLFAIYAPRLGDAGQADMPSFLTEHQDSTLPRTDHEDAESARPVITEPDSENLDAEMLQWKAEFIAHIEHLRQPCVATSCTMPTYWPEIHESHLAAISLRADIAQGMLDTAPTDAQPLVLEVLKAAAGDLRPSYGMPVEQALAGLRMLSLMFQERLRQDELTSPDLTPGRLKQIADERAWMEDRLILRSEHDAVTKSLLDDGDREWMQHFIKHVAAVQPMETFLTRRKRVSSNTISVNELKHRLPLLDGLALALLVTPNPYTPPGIQRMLEAVVWQPHARMDFMAVATALRQLVVQVGTLQDEREGRSEAQGHSQRGNKLDCLYARYKTQAHAVSNRSLHHPDAFMPEAMAQELLDRASYLPNPIKHMLHELMGGLPPGLDMSDDAVDALLNTLLEKEAMYLGLPVTSPKPIIEARDVEAQADGPSVEDTFRPAGDLTRLAGLPVSGDSEYEDALAFGAPMLILEPAFAGFMHDQMQHALHQSQVLSVEDHSAELPDSDDDDLHQQRLPDPSFATLTLRDMVRELDEMVAATGHDLADLQVELIDSAQAAAEVDHGLGRGARFAMLAGGFPGDGDAISDDDEDHTADSRLFRLTGRRWTDLTDEAQLAMAMEGLHLPQDGEILEYSDDEEVEILHRVLNLN